jgi:UDP-2,3-diacylglucosamine pyrophosphatase LpxH
MRNVLKAANEKPMKNVGTACLPRALRSGSLASSGSKTHKCSLERHVSTATAGFENGIQRLRLSEDCGERGVVPVVAAGREPACLALDSPEPIVILSDLHIGHAASLVTDLEELSGLWQGAGTVIFNGDTVDLDVDDSKRETRKRISRLLQLVRRAGATPILIAGNHDPSLVSTRAIELSGGEVLVTHGDCLHPAIAPWSGEAKLSRRLFRDCLQRFDEELNDGDDAHADALERVLRAAQLASVGVARELQRERAAESRLTSMQMLSRFAAKPHKVLRVLHYWQRFPGLAARFLEMHRPDTRFLVVGHSHRPGAWRVGERVIINTGAFQPLGRPSIVRIADGRISFSDLVHGSDGWRAGSPAAATFKLMHRGSAEQAA